MNIALWVILIITFLLAIWYIIKHQEKPVDLKDEYIIGGPFGSIIERDESTGLPIYVKDSFGNESWYRYNKLGKLIEYKSSNGIHQLYKYKKGKRVLISFNSKKTSL